jgi:hypothetical protein
VLAHPWGRGNHRVLDEPSLVELCDMGLAGLEVDHLDHDQRARSRLRSIANDLDLVPTGGSDYHGTGKTGVTVGSETTTPEDYARLLEQRKVLRR